MALPTSASFGLDFPVPEKHYPAPKTIQEQLKELEESYDALQARKINFDLYNTALQKKCRENKTTMDENQEKLGEKDREINALKTQIESNEANIEYQEKQIVKVEEDLEAVTKKLAERELELQTSRSDYKLLEIDYTRASKSSIAFESANKILQNELNVEKRKTADALRDLAREEARKKTAQSELEDQRKTNVVMQQEKNVKNAEMRSNVETIAQLQSDVADNNRCREELARAQAQSEELQRQFELLRGENDDFRSRPRYVAPEGTAPYQGPATFADELEDLSGSFASHSQRSSVALTSEVEQDLRSSFDSIYDSSPRRGQQLRSQTPPAILSAGGSSTPPTPLPPKLIRRNPITVQTAPIDGSSDIIITNVVKTEKESQIRYVSTSEPVNVYIPVQYIHNNPLSQWFVVERNLVLLIAHLVWYTIIPFFRLGLSKTGICTPPPPYQTSLPASDPNHPPEYIRNLLRNNNTLPFIQANTAGDGIPINAAAQAGLQRHTTLQPFIPSSLNINLSDLPSWTLTLLSFLIHCQIYYLIYLTGYNIHQRDLWLAANDLTRSAIHELAAKRSGIAYWSWPKSLLGERVGSGYERYLAGVVTSVLKFEPRNFALPG